MTTQKNNKAINIALWIAQGLIALMFIMAGLMKASQPLEELVKGGLIWANETPIALIRFIGISEILGGLGLLLPSILKKKPFLTIWAALGLAIVMVLAAIFHASRGEFTNIGANVVLLAIALFIAWGRSKKAPIKAK